MGTRGASKAAHATGKLYHVAMSPNLFPGRHKVLGLAHSVGIHLRSWEGCCAAEPVCSFEASRPTGERRKTRIGVGKPQRSHAYRGYPGRKACQTSQVRLCRVPIVVLSGETRLTYKMASLWPVCLLQRYRQSCIKRRGGLVSATKSYVERRGSSLRTEASCT